MSTNFRYACPNCEHENYIKYEPGRPAQVYGPAEKCYPADPDEFEPTNCEKCDFEFDAADISELASEQAQADREDYWESKRNREKDDL